MTHHSTATKRSTCLALALLAIVAATGSSAARGFCDDGDCSSGGSRLSSFGSATIVHRAPIRLDLASSSELRHPNASAFYSEEEEEGEYDLPAELAAMIASARSPLVEVSSYSSPSSPAAAPTIAAGGVRYYATHDHEGGALCSSRPASEFGAWEESFGSVTECCEGAYGWDVEGCEASI